MSSINKTNQPPCISPRDLRSEQPATAPTASPSKQHSFNQDNNAFNKFRVNPKGFGMSGLSLAAQAPKFPLFPGGPALDAGQWADRIIAEDGPALELLYAALYHG